MESLVIVVQLVAAGFVLIFCLRRFFECLIEEPKGRERTLWLLIILFGNIFGALGYYVFRHVHPRGSTPVLERRSS